MDTLSYNMGDVFNRREPSDTTIIHQNPEVVVILENYQWLGFFEKIAGFNDEVSLEFWMNLQKPEGQGLIIVVNVLVIYVIEDSINKVTTPPKGIHWNNEKRQEAINSKSGFFLLNEQHDEDKNIIRRESLPYPWVEVAYHIIK